MTAVAGNNKPEPDSEASPNYAGLLPCPFGVGHQLHLQDSATGEEWIACESCGARGPKMFPGGAADAWNTRTTKAEPSRQDEIDDLRAALSAINVHLGSAETHDSVIDDITRKALEKDWSTKAVTS